MSQVSQASACDVESVCAARYNECQEDRMRDRWHQLRLRAFLEFRGAKRPLPRIPRIPRPPSNRQHEALHVILKTWRIVLLKTDSPTQIALLGLGYVGCLSAACLASLGHRVLGIDRDHHKVGNVLQGRAPFYEPGLENLVRDNVAAGRLSASTSASGIADAGIVLICVGTPSEKNGNLGLSQLRRAIEEIAKQLPGRSQPLIVAIRSTVFPGTCEEVVLPALAGHASATGASNPEFLREGTAVRGFLEPSFLC